jgi:hypothetical protein
MVMKVAKAVAECVVCHHERSLNALFVITSEARDPLLEKQIPRFARDDHSATGY